MVLVAQLKMGPQGAGIATTVAEWIAALCFLGVLAGKLPSADGNKLGSGRASSESGNIIVPVFELPKWTDIRPLVVASSAVFLRSIVLQVAMSSAAAMAARSSAESDIIASGASSSVAAHQIALQLWLLCSFLCDVIPGARTLKQAKQNLATLDWTLSAEEEKMLDEASSKVTGFLTREYYTLL